MHLTSMVVASTSHVDRTVCTTCRDWLHYSSTKRWKLFGELPNGGMEVALEDSASTSSIAPTDEELKSLKYFTELYLNVVNLQFCLSFLATVKHMYLCN